MGAEELDLAAIRARAAAATPGPWQRYTYRHGGSRIYVEKPKRELIADTGNTYRTDDDEIAVTYQRGDADFLFHARTDIPALLAEVERLRSLVVAHHYHGRALPLGQPCPVCVREGCAHPEHDLSAIVEGGGSRD